MEGFRIPVPPMRSGVYHLVRAGVVVYVGQTENIFSRLGGHRDKDFDDVQFFPCAVAELDAREEEHIARLKPELNSEGVRKPYRPCRRARGVWLVERAS